MPKLLGKSSSINVRKVLWLSAEMQLPLEHEEWGSGFRPTQTQEFLALNPNAMVPVLIDDDGFVLWESNSICRYLATSRGRDDLLPPAAAGRARVEQWMDWQATELNNSWRYAFVSIVRQSPAHQDPQALAQGIAEWNRHMAVLDGQLAKTAAFAAGTQFTLADIVLGLSVNRWRVTLPERPRLAEVEAYHERLCQRAPFLQHGCNGLP